MKIILTIEAESHADYKTALSILAQGVGTTELEVQGTATTLAVKPERQKRSKPAPALPEKPIGPDEDEEEDDETPKRPRKKPVVEEEDDEEDAPPPAKKAKEVDLDPIRELAMEKNKTHRDEVKKLIKSYGVVTFSEIAPDKLSDFHAKLKKIGSKKKVAEEEEDDEFLK